MEEIAALPIDPMLRAFVGLSNDLGIEVGMSVLVGGIWVSGVLIAPRVYTTELGNEISARAGAAGEGLRTFFDTVGREWFPNESERDVDSSEQSLTEPGDDEDAEPRRAYHLHLRHARTFVGEVPVPADGFYIRIRLDQVAGWTIGELGPPGYRSSGPPPPVG